MKEYFILTIKVEVTVRKKVFVIQTKLKKKSSQLPVYVNSATSRMPNDVNQMPGAFSFKRFISKEKEKFQRNVKENKAKL